MIYNNEIEQVYDKEKECESRTLAEELYCEIKSKILSEISKRVEHVVDSNGSIGYAGNNTSLPFTRITKKLNCMDFRTLRFEHLVCDLR